MDATSLALGIVGYLTLFAFAGVAFLFVNLVIGRLLRPQHPHPEKLEIYECGEPAIGSSFVQFDIRFYVVALLFIIFDVEVALFFPWAIVFGKATRLANEERPSVEYNAGRVELAAHARGLLQELGVDQPQLPQQGDGSAEGSRASSAKASDARQLSENIRLSMQRLSWITAIDILAFFGVLMVGFLYVWKRGDLDWVRAITRQQGVTVASPETATVPESPLLDQVAV